MENFWKKAVKVTGPVAVIGFIFVLVVKSIFRQDVINVFGSEQTFYLTVFILCILAVLLALSVILYSGKAMIDNEQSDEKGRSVSIEKSDISGDIVLGDKTINQGHKRDE